MNSAKPIVVGLGEVLWDVFPDGPRFGGAPAHLRVPYTAMTAFADPSVEFGLQLAVPQAPLEVRYGSSKGTT